MPAASFALDYWTDSCQRLVLLLDILRQRGNTYRERARQTTPNVLSFGAQLVKDGRTLPRPVNYVLVSITPPKGVVVDTQKAPFVVVDPRAGHGPGIGGMKADSEIGEALKAGHPCYFIGFLPEPVPGQTIEDVCVAEATFLEEVIARHPHAHGKPVIIANCQAGWQIMMTAAIRPDLPGPILLAGSPLSYWSGVRGKNPMRYTGGNLGGAWMTALAGDLGDGVFDGAHLVANFELLDLANTFWRKPYNVYSKVDTEGPRFLGFEEWWGSPVLLNAEEMQWIVDHLFIGDRLATGALRTSDDLRIDLRNIRSPIIVFCSWGDNITPPQQALGWITDLYKDDLEIAENGQTIVYTLHDTIGHLGIFVSGKVAAKEHKEFVACMELIDLLPPGLYEAKISEAGPDAEGQALTDGRYVFALQRRTLDDIRALGANSAEDERCFAAAARVSEINCGLYDAMVRPLVRAATTQAGAEVARRLHPNRMRFAMFSDQNPLMRPVETLAETAREKRLPVSPDNPLLSMERIASTWIDVSLETLGLLRDATAESLFFSVYSSPVLQAMVGLGRSAPAKSRRERDLLREVVKGKQREKLEPLFETGGLAEASLRALIYVLAPGGGIDERAFAMLRELRDAQPAGDVRSMQELKALLRQQSLLMRFDEERALAAIPALLPREESLRTAAFEMLKAMLSVGGSLSNEGKRRLKHIEAVFSAQIGAPSRTGAAHAGRQHHHA